MRRRATSNLPLLVVALALGVAIGSRLGREAPPAPAAPPPGEVGAAVWTCAMHPQIRLEKPGPCPVCGMDLIPAEDGGEDRLDASRYRMSAAAKALARVETAPVARRAVSREIAMVGKVTYDETRVETISARFPGRLDRLFVDYTGVPVKAGDHLASIYSPELRTAQQELLQALQASREIRGDVRFLRETTEATVAAAREKLRLWGLNPEQVKAIERSGKVSDLLTLFAHQSGIVVEKHRSEGDYVQEGSKIYTVADLTRLWVNLDAYESDLAWIHYGQAVRFETEAYPGQAFEGRISFIHPILDERTRTVKIRVNVENPRGRLKPGMFVRARVHAELTGAGGVRDRALAGKWISPMHPEVVEDEPGPCRVCGMPLVPAESLGLVGDGAPRALPLVIPATAALRTGKRAMVYVEVPGTATPTYEGRVVTLGPRAGDAYVVEDGLREGERVVVHGNFKIDSAVQLQAGRSMMTIPGEGEGEAPRDAHPPGDHDHGGHDHAPPAPPLDPDREALLADARLLAATLSGYLAASDLATASALLEGAPLAARLGPDPADPPGFATARRQLADSLAPLRGAADLEAFRRHFATFSDLVLTLARRYPPPAGEFAAFGCPMAFSGRGARWLQVPGPIANPYFGDAMLRCGEPVALGAGGG